MPKRLNSKWRALRAHNARKKRAKVLKVLPFHVWEDDGGALHPKDET